MSLRDALEALNESDPSTSARLAGEGVVDPARVAISSAEDAFDAPMMIMNQIHEA